MTLAHARALLPAEGVHAEPDRPERDRAALRALAEWATRFSPVVAPDEPDGLLLDVTGCAHLFGGEHGLVRHIHRAMDRLGFASRVAVAPTFGCAWGVARFGRRKRAVVPDGEQRRAMGGLPVRALRLDEDTEAALEEVGIRRVEHLLDLPRCELPARFGGDVLLRLDQALGEAIETIEPVRARRAPRSGRVFDGPTTRPESIEAAARDALHNLCAMLERRGQGVRLLEAVLDRGNVAPARFVISLSRPSREARHLWSLLRRRLERVHLGFGVEGIVLTAARTGRVRHEQGELTASGPSRKSASWAPSPAGTRRDIAAVIDVLVNRLGAERVVRAETIESYLPERAFRFLPLEEAHRRRVPGSGAARAGSDRPSMLLDRPEPARAIALTPQGPLLSLTWRGREQRIVACQGPERISHEWWRDDRAGTSDWFRVQDEAGRWLWVCREAESGRWSVRGLWA